MITIKQVREIAKGDSNPYGYKVTVIKREGNIVVRKSMSSPRHVKSHAESLCLFLKRNGIENATPNVFSGAKSGYVHYWAEAIIPITGITTPQGE